MIPEFNVVMSRGAASLDVVRYLRYRVLREPLELTYESTLFDGDGLESTLHGIGYLHESPVLPVPVGCLTLLVPQQQPEPSQVLVQLRGMAVLEEHQGSGVGKALLQHVHGMARENDWQLWCNARTKAVPFYAKLGWCVDGEAFDVPGIGKHFKMFWERSD